MAVDKKVNYEMQGNEKPARNYLGKQKTVTVPVKWQSNPKAPKTELAYITKAEKDLLIKKDIHGSLKNGPNKGPSGIMSLDSQGDYTRDRSQDNARSNMSRGDSERAVRDEARLKEVLTGQVDRGQTSKVSDRVREGAVPEYAYGPDGQPRYIGGGQKFVGKGLFNRSGYRDIQNKTGGFLGFGGRQDIQYNPVTGRYEFEEEETGEVKPGFGGRIFGGILSALTGIPLVGSAIGGAIDRYKPKSYFDKLDPKELARLNSLSLTNPLDQKVYNPKGDTSMVINDPFAKTLFADSTEQPNVGSMGQVIPQDNRITQSVTEGPYSTGGLDSYLEDDLTTNQGIVNTNAFTNPNSFNVNQNYGTTGALPNSEYPTSINQNMLTDEDYQYFQNSLKNGGLAGIL